MVLINSNLLYPQRAMLRINTDCNLGCDVCILRYRDFRNLTMEYTTFLNILDRMPPQIKEIGLLGWGEGTILEYFNKMLKDCKAREKKTYTVTNGSNLPNIDFENLDYLTISYYPELFKRHSSFLRGINSTKLRLTQVIGKHTLSSMNDVLEWAKKCGFSSVKYVFMECYDEATKHLMLTEGDLEIFKDKLATCITEGKNHGIEIIHPLTNEKCTYAQDTLQVEFDGSVRPCTKSKEIVGNVLSQNIEEILKNQLYEPYRQNTHTDCRQCNYCNSPSVLDVRNLDQRLVKFWEEENH